MVADRRRKTGPISPELLAERMEFRAFIAGMVRGSREVEGWSQAELGRRVGVSRWTISQLELGRVVVGFDVLLQLLKAFAPVSLIQEIFEARYNDRWEPHSRPSSPGAAPSSAPEG